MDFKSIRCFRVVYEEKSINRAAKLLFITPQGLSKTISHLEDELSVPLFTREKTGMEPTLQGEYFYEKTSGLVETFDEIAERIRFLQEEENTLHLGISQGVLDVFTPPGMFSRNGIAAGQNVAEIKIDWEERTTDEVIKGLRREQYDVGLVIGTPAYASDFYMKEILSKSPMAIVYPGHAFYEKQSLTVKDLEGEPLISLNEHFSLYHNLMQRAGDYGFVPEFAAKTMESSLIYRLCRRQMGIGIDVDIHEGNILGELRAVLITDLKPWVIHGICLMPRKEEAQIREFFRSME